MLNILHFKNIKNDCCSINYPWGWRSQNKIKKILKKDNKKVEIQNNLQDNINIYKTHFEIGAKKGYKILLEGYNSKIDFLDYYYTNPSLSIALNNLNKNNKIDNICTENIKIKIIDNRIEKNTINTNFNYFGFFDKNELLHNLIAGGLGPEWTHIWDWERNIIDNNYTWQIRNINEIIKYQNP